MYKYDIGQLSLSEFGQPVGMRLREDNRWVQKAKTVPLFKFNEQGYIVFEGEEYSPDIFSGVGKIGNKKVKCVDAENQVLFRLGYEHDKNDIHDVRLLCERFNIPIPKEYK
jgi:hypothetical protein